MKNKRNFRKSTSLNDAAFYYLMGASGGISTMAIGALTNLGGLGLNPILGIFCVILMGYAVIKVFFALSSAQSLLKQR